MSPLLRHIKSEHNIINEGSYASHKPTNATFISKEIMETNKEKKSIRQAGELISNESKLVENKETKGQKET